jgi:hypothetical protein
MQFSESVNSADAATEERIKKMNVYINLKQKDFFNMAYPFVETSLPEGSNSLKLY